MKAYLFIETGEVREPQTGEWGIDDDGWIVPWNDDSADEKETILTRHEIEINPLADILTVSQGNKGVPLCIEWKEIPIPRPKKKVTRWKWYIVEEDDTTDERYTQLEADMRYEGYTLFRLDPTAREEEE